MFAKACQIVSHFTKPIIINFRKADGTCASSIGTIVIINKDGWFLTAKHILEFLSNINGSKVEHDQLVIKRKKIEEDPTIVKHEKIRQLKIHSINNDMVTNFHVWCGWPQVELLTARAMPNIDLGIGKLNNFNSSMVKEYPKLKDPSKPMPIGSSLCKIGYPFHQINVSFNTDTQTFDLPAGSVYPPLFPIDGIFTRVILTDLGRDKGYPSMIIETSSPGLKGQSGGPTFDINGNIWAIQSSTTHHKLGFDGGEKSGLTNKEAEHLKNQYLNVGWGIHSTTIIGFLKENNINFDLSLN